MHVSAATGESSPETNITGAMNPQTSMATHLLIAARGHAVLCASLACFFAGTMFVRAEPPLPPKPGRYFNDYAKVVPAAAATSINARLEQFERETSNQILVAVFPKLPEGTYLEDFTVKTAQFWGPGGKKRDNGLVLFAFIADRKIRMEVGYGLEGVVPDSIAASIIRDVIRPQFKAGNYAAGLDQGVEAIFKATRHEYHGTGRTLADKSTGRKGSDGTALLVGFVLLAVFLIWCQMGDTVVQRGGRFLFWNLLVNSVVSGRSSGGGSSGGGFSGGGGGFSGGGGSFGGGGASGDW